MQRNLAYILVWVALLGSGVVAWAMPADEGAAPADAVTVPRPTLRSADDPLREWWLYVLSRGERGTADVWSEVFADPLVYGELAAELLIGSVRYAGVDVADPDALERSLDPRVLYMRGDRALVQYRVPGSGGGEAIAALLREGGEWRLLRLGIPAGWDGFDRLDLRAALLERLETGELLAVNDDWATYPPIWRATETGIEVEALLVRLNPFDTPIRSRLQVQLLASDGHLVATAPAAVVEATHVGEEVSLIVRVDGIPPSGIAAVRIGVAEPGAADAEPTWYLHDDPRYYWYWHPEPPFRVALPSAPYRFYTDSRWGESRLVFYLESNEPRLEVGVVPTPPGGAEALRAAVLGRWTTALRDVRTETAGQAVSRQGLPYVVEAVTGTAASGERGLVGIVTFEGETHIVYFLLVMDASRYGAPGNGGREAWLEAIHTFRWR